MRSFSSLVFLLPLAVSAAPLTADPLSCDVDPAVLASLQQDDAVISYCSRYLLIDATTFTESATETPESVYTTILATTTGDAVTTTETSTETTSTDTTTTETITETAYTTTTLVTTTATLTCLDAAYTASAPTVEDPPVETPVVQTIPGRKREVDTTCSRSSTAKPTTTIVVFATTTVCPCTETSSKAPCTESSLHGSASYAASITGSSGYAAPSGVSSSTGSASHGPFASSHSYLVPGNSTVAPSGSLISASSYVSGSRPTSSYVSSTSWAVSSACSCLSIPTPTITATLTQTLEPGTITDYSTETFTPTITETTTVTSTTTNTITENPVETSTSTLTAYATATTIASNGAAYRKYTHPFNANLVNSGFYSSYFKSLTPDFSGSLQSLTFSSPNWPSGSTYVTLADRSESFESQQAAVLAQGFFIAKQTGTYTLSSSDASIDNWGYLWTGDDAYSAWSDANAAFMASRTGAGYYGGEKTLVLNAGDAVPLTWLWANGGGVAQSYFAITAPDGSYVTDSTGYLVQACSAGTFA